MIRTRLLIGTVLALMAAALLYLDGFLAPWYPLVGDGSGGTLACRV